MCLDVLSTVISFFLSSVIKTQFQWEPRMLCFDSLSLSSAEFICSFQKNKTKAMAVESHDVVVNSNAAACDWLDDEFFHFRAKIENARAIPTLVVYVCIMLN